MVDEDRAAALAQSARAERRGPSRALWIVALVLGLAAAIGFVVMLLAEPSSPSTTPPRSSGAGGLGFGTGVLVGAALGIGVGYAIARQRQSARNTP